MKPKVSRSTGGLGTPRFRPRASSIPTSFMLSRHPATYGHTSAVTHCAGSARRSWDDGVWANRIRLGRPPLRLGECEIISQFF